MSASNSTNVRFRHNRRRPLVARRLIHLNPSFGLSSSNNNNSISSTSTTLLNNTNPVVVAISTSSPSSPSPSSSPSLSSPSSSSSSLAISTLAIHHQHHPPPLLLANSCASFSNNSNNHSINGSVITPVSSSSLPFDHNLIYSTESSVSTNSHHPLLKNQPSSLSLEDIEQILCKETAALQRGESIHTKIEQELDQEEIEVEALKLKLLEGNSQVLSGSNNDPLLFYPNTEEDHQLFLSEFTSDLNNLNNISDNNFKQTRPKFLDDEDDDEDLKFLELDLLSDHDDDSSTGGLAVSPGDLAAAAASVEGSLQSLVASLSASKGDTTRIPLDFGCNYHRIDDDDEDLIGKEDYQTTIDLNLLTPSVHRLLFPENYTTTGSSPPSMFGSNNPNNNNRSQGRQQQQQQIISQVNPQQNPQSSTSHPHHHHQPQPHHHHPHHLHQIQQPKSSPSLQIQHPLQQSCLTQTQPRQQNLYTNSPQFCGGNLQQQQPPSLSSSSSIVQSISTVGGRTHHHQQPPPRQLPPHPHLLQRQDSQILFGGSCCSSNTTTTSTFDSVSNYGSGNSSTNSSTPSTPSSIIGSGGSVLSPQQQQQQQQLLPSFQEIYSPPRYSSTTSTSCGAIVTTNTSTNTSSTTTTNTELNFDPFIGGTVGSSTIGAATGGDYFKFEDYISESGESDLDNTIDNITDTRTAVQPLQQQSHLPIQIKQEQEDESMDTIDFGAGDPLMNIVTTAAGTSFLQHHFQPSGLVTSTSTVGSSISPITSASTSMVLKMEQHDKDFIEEEHRSCGRDSRSQNNDNTSTNRGLIEDFEDLDEDLEEHSTSDVNISQQQMSDVQPEDVEEEDDDDEDVDDNHFKQHNTIKKSSSTTSSSSATTLSSPMFSEADFSQLFANVQVPITSSSKEIGQQHQSTTMSTCTNPPATAKTMRIHLHNLSLSTLSNPQQQQLCSTSSTTASNTSTPYQQTALPFATITSSSPSSSTATTLSPMSSSTEPTTSILQHHHQEMIQQQLETLTTSGDSIGGNSSNLSMYQLPPSSSSSSTSLSHHHHHHHHHQTMMTASGGNSSSSSRRSSAASTATTTSPPPASATSSGSGSGSGHHRSYPHHRGSTGNSGSGTKKQSQREHHKSKSTLQSCAVCGDVAACQHYGVLTCEGCKGFFKRTVQKGSKYTCLGSKDCTVDKRRRNRCQFCRFQKCLAVGMVKEVVRTDSLKGRRGRLPSKPKSPHQQDQSNLCQHSPPMSTIAFLLKAHDETSADKANLDFSRFSEKFDNQTADQQVLSLLSTSLDNLWEFMEKIPGFNKLSNMDKKCLFHNSCLELFALRLAYKITPGINFIVLCNNIVLHRKQIMFTLGEWLPMIEELSKQLHSMNLDINAFVCLCALTVITARNGCQDPNQQIEQIENKIINSLRDHTVYNNDAQKKPYYFTRILAKLSELRSIGEYGQRIIIKKIKQLEQSFSQQQPTSSSSTSTIQKMPIEILELERKISPFMINTTCDISTPTTTAITLSSTSTSSMQQQLDIDLQAIVQYFKD